ncbi:MAG: ABC transporter permease [Tannerellaceae bacterium]|jgi:putative ABC transport system permease protein|nr:ABC transporter permease [Tannerellaceae bacterium]
MFDFDDLREIWSTMKKNKLRTFLTGFSVAWGIFMLIVLLAAGNGLRNGIAANFDRWAANMVEIWPRYTTKPYDGLPSNRRIEFTERDIAAIKRSFPEVDLISGISYRNDTISYGKEYLNANIRAVYPDYCRIVYMPIPSGSGRFINEPDMHGRRKSIVISQPMIKVLFRDSLPALGRYVKISGAMFKIIGIYKQEESNSDNVAYIPFTTGQLLFDRGYRVGDIDFTVKGLNTEVASIAFEKKLRSRIARLHRFDSDDKNALGYYDMGNEFRMWHGMNNGIAMFIWIIGIGTLMAGIVGVSNIMLITVRERTKEFGIRKAIGAKPLSILKMIIVESILVTAVFGYIGMISGIGLSEAINYAMNIAREASGESSNDTVIFRNPTVSLGISVSATIVLIIAGVLAGYFPARKAIKITAIEAMREE